MKHFLRSIAAVLLLHGMIAGTHAGTADEDWQAVVALDAGPGEQPKDADSASRIVRAHSTRQEAALRAFLAAHPKDSHAFEAQLRLARLFALRAELEDSEKLRAESKRLLDELDKTATAEQRPEVEFSQVVRLMRGLRATDPAQRDELLDAARRFQRDYPNDRRVAALLTEVATLFDAQPATKEMLLEDAQAAARDGDLKARIADDLKRTRLLGQVLTLNFTSVQGEEIKSESLRGRPVFVIFFAASSLPAMAAIGKLQHELAQLPSGSVRVVGVSLDGKRETVAALLKARSLTWPVIFDGKGWESPLVRGFGVNALPTVWLLDARGRLQYLNALAGAADKALQLLRDR